MRQKADFLLVNAGQLLTMSGPATPRSGSDMGELGLVKNGAVAACGGMIIAAGPATDVMANIETSAATKIYDASGRVVMPCFCDPHTHAVWAGSRENEFVQRLQGADYLEILQAGGGILHTVRATRAAAAEELLIASRNRLDSFLACGVGTLEIKSGYGLDSETEIKQLQTAKTLGMEHPVDVVTTFLGAHAFPPEYSDNKDAYVDLVISEMLPRVAGLAEFCDVFCEESVFSLAQSRRILEAAKRYGLKPKIHADEIVPTGGAQLAAEVGALTADHLLTVTPEGIAALAKAGIIAVLLPGTAFFLMKARYAPARAMIEAGVPVALSTDCNPGSSPTTAMNLIISLACLSMKMSPEEALCAATINAAHALGRGREVGSLEPGKYADLTVFGVRDYREIPYYYGVNTVESVYKKGNQVVG
jgi:imidazolonepropionase